MINATPVRAPYPVSLFFLRPLAKDRSITALASSLRVASAHSLHAAPVREHFSALALISPDNFTQQPAMADLLQRLRQGANYSNEIAALPTTFWQTVEL